MEGSILITAGLFIMVGAVRIQEKRKIARDGTFILGIIVLFLGIGVLAATYIAP